MRPEDLAQVLRRLSPAVDPNLIVGVNPADDAAVYRLDDETALVFTADFFTPIVDDPFDYGAIAVANALSDVYAMGGRPLMGLNLVAFPTKKLSVDILSEILRGGNESAHLAGIPIVGGHTVEDDEPKYGLAVVGLVSPDAVWTKAGGRPGDQLFLTKPLGTGIVATAHKRASVEPSDLAAAVASMRLLNRDAADAARPLGVHCATDITGYGLLGHLLEVCRASGVAAELSARALPLLPGVRRYVAEGHVPGGSRSNLRFVESEVAFHSEIDETMRLVCADAQTSGGLLLAIPESQAPALAQALAARGIAAARIGSLVAHRDAAGAQVRVLA